MARINTLDDLKKLREQARQALNLRKGGVKVSIRASMSTVGIAAGSRDVLKAIMDELEKRNFHDVEITETGSIGLDNEEPVVSVTRDGAETVYGKVTADRARQIVAQHVVNGEPIPEWTIARKSK